jgi:putative N6-adenine-specific DNA methylase
MCAHGLEDSLNEELKTFCDLECIKKNKGGVNFTANAEAICKLNLWARIPSRILIQLGKTQVTNATELLDFAHRINWGKWFAPLNSFRVDVSSTGRLPKSMSANYAALKFKDGLCDRFRSDFNGERPTVNTRNPEIRIWIHFVNSLVTVSIDTSGEPLFKRGWRESKGAAPIKENLASALLAMTNWDMSQPLIDPMCGSGTFIIEAMQKYARLPANFLPTKVRKFACENFSTESPFRKVDWNFLRKEAMKSWEKHDNILEDFPLIIGSDSSREMIDIAKQNASLALPVKISKSIVWEVSDFSNCNIITKKKSTPGVLVTNPPFGMRIEFDEDTKKKFSSMIRLRHEKNYPVFNGDIACNWLSFKMVTGAMKDKNET